MGSSRRTGVFAVASQLDNVRTSRLVRNHGLSLAMRIAHDEDEEERFTCGLCFSKEIVETHLNERP